MASWTWRITGRGLLGRGRPPVDYSVEFTIEASDLTGAWIAARVELDRIGGLTGLGTAITKVTVNDEPVDPDEFLGKLPATPPVDRPNGPDEPPG
jgi:hypothetical protein